MVRIGLSWHGGDSEYDAYESALRRRAKALELDVSAVWLAGKGRPTLTGMVRHLDGILLTGGEDVEPHRYGRGDAVEVCACDPERDAVEFALLEEWQHRPLPILAICRGAQVLNVFHGGTLIPDLGRRNAAHRAPRTKEHDVNIVDGTTLAAIAKSPRALTNSSHHQAVDRLAEGFHLSAVADDGTIEAFESSTDSGSFILGVQWHPELMAPDLPLSQRVLDYFLTQRASTNHGLLSGHE